MRTTVLYEDRDIIVAHKPAGLATQTAAVGQADMVSELKNHMKNGYLGVVHRLDQPVEGVLIFGKNKEAATDLSKQLAEGILNKHYYCVVCGQPQASSGELADYLYKSAGNRAEIVSEEAAGRRQAKLAVLQYRVLESVPVGAALQGRFSVSEEVLSLVEVVLKTGRFHQIRAQMAHAGMPLLGDRKYADPFSAELNGKIPVRSVALCAYDLRFRHPKKGEDMEFRTVPQAPIFQIFPKLTEM